MLFPKTIEVFKKITFKAKSTPTEGLLIAGTKFEVSDKQFEWLASIYIAEAKGWDTKVGATVLDDEGNQYSFSYKTKHYNVPHYIPNREKYGCKYYVTLFPVLK